MVIVRESLVHQGSSIFRPAYREFLIVCLEITARPRPIAAIAPKPR